MSPGRKALIALVVTLLVLWAATTPGPAANAVSAFGTGVVNVANALIQGFSHIKFGGTR